MPQDFAERVIRWQAQHGRHDLPWQQPATPYRVWVSEVMLQQTRVETVREYFNRFMACFPDIPSLAQAEQDEVLGLWSGLGYYARGRNLHRAAQIVVAEHSGALPTDFDALQALPGIGRSTAGAIQSLGQGIRQPILDGNLKRVLARHAGIEGWPGRSVVAKQLWAESEARTPATGFAAYNQGMMDIGATRCLRQPRCADCPVAADCIARKNGTTDRIPGRKPKRAVPERSVCMLVLQTPDTGDVLLERRPSRGIWGGLWSLPEFTDEAALHAWLGQHLEQAWPPESLPPVQHTFTHFRLTIQPCRVVLKPQDRPATGPARTWCQPGKPPGGLPAPIQRLLAGLDAAPTGRV